MVEEMEIGDRLEQIANVVCDNGIEMIAALINTKRDILRRDRR
jgi:hypothetical protein